MRNLVLIAALLAAPLVAASPASAFLGGCGNCAPTTPIIVQEAPRAVPSAPVQAEELPAPPPRPAPPPNFTVQENVCVPQTFIGRGSTPAVAERRAREAAERAQATAPGACVNREELAGLRTQADQVLGLRQQIARLEGQLEEVRRAPPAEAAPAPAEEPAVPPPTGVNWGVVIAALALIGLGFGLDWLVGRARRQAADPPTAATPPDAR